MKEIAVLGGGYAGLKTVKDLQKFLKPGQAHITLVNKNDYHYEATDLHEVAAGNQPVEKITYKITDVVKPEYTTFVQDEVEGIDPKKQTVSLKNHDDLHYDYCVFALGFVSETFGIKGAEENALPMANVDQAVAIHQHLVDKMKDYRQTKNPDDLKIIICGAGFTGIELSGALAEARPKLAEIAGVTPDQISITTIDGATKILGMFKPSLAEYGRNLVEKQGVKIITGAMINSIEPGKVLYPEGKGANAKMVELPAGTIIWTTGVSGSPVVAKSGLPGRRGRVAVTSQLADPDYANLYIIGDVAAVFAPGAKRPYPTTAQISLRMATFVAHQIADQLNGKEPEKTFVYKSLGTVASVGNTHAFGQSGKLTLKGYFASVTKKMIADESLYKVGGVKELMADGRFDIYH